MASQYRSEKTISEFNATTGEYTEKQKVTEEVLCDEVFFGESLDLVSGVGKVIANLNGTWVIQIESDDDTATMTLTVDGNSLDWKKSISITVSGTSVFVDADKNCSITYSALRTS